MRCLCIAICLLFAQFLVSTIAAAEIELLSGKRMEGEILDETDSLIRVKVRMGDSSAQMSFKKKLIHRLREDGDAEWRVINAKPGMRTSAADSGEKSESGQKGKQVEAGKTAEQIEEKPAGRPSGLPVPFGWRGDGTGLYPNGRAPTALKQVWRCQLDTPTHASPVVIGNKIFTLKEPHSLVCVDAQSGEILWEEANPHEVHGKGGSYPKNGFVNTCYGYTCPTPVADAEHVYAVFGHGVVVCYDHAGKRKWANKFPVEGKQRSGVSQGPCLGGTTLFIGGAAEYAFAGFDKDSGAFKWNIKRHGGIRGKGSFVPVVHGGKPCMLASDGIIVDESGAELQTGIIAQRNYGPSCVVADGVAYAVDSMGNALLATTIGGSQKWSIPLEKNEKPSRSPLVHEGLVYVPGKVFTVVDAETGEKVHSFGVQGGWSSPVLAGDQIVMICDKEIVVIQPGRQAEIVHRFGHSFANRGGSDWRLGCTPVFVDQVWYHRDGDSLYCFAAQ